MAGYTPICEAFMRGILVVSTIAVITSMGFTIATLTFAAMKSDNLAKGLKATYKFLQNLIDTNTCQDQTALDALPQLLPINLRVPHLLTRQFKHLVVGAAAGILVLTFLQLLAASMALFSRSQIIASRTVFWRITLALCIPLTFLITLLPFAYEPGRSNFSLSAIPTTFRGIHCLTGLGEKSVNHFLIVKSIHHHGLTCLNFVLVNVYQAALQIFLMILSFLIGCCGGQHDYARV